MFARIPKKRTTPRRKRPWLTRKPRQERTFLDPRSYVTKGGRVRLYGADYSNLRVAAYVRSTLERGFRNCECGCGQPAPMNGWFDSSRGELSHNEHGARKSDELERVKWMRHECHMRLHNPKAVLKKPKLGSFTPSTATARDA